jgi:Gnt-I system low-affinity gluconate transporter
MAIGVPAAIVAGPLYARFITRHVSSAAPPPATATSDGRAARLPPIHVVATLIALPLVMILGNTVATLTLSPDSTLRAILIVVGHPMVALLATALLSFYLLGTRTGHTRDQVQAIATSALEPAGIVILVTGAGGALKQVLIDSGVGQALADALATSNWPSLLLAFVIAAAVRIMQGSATVAMLSAAGLVAALLDDLAIPDAVLALHVVVIAAGASIASHVNDSGFWLVSRYLGLSVADTLKTWTALTTIVALFSLALAMLVALLL